MLFPFSKLGLCEELVTVKVCPCGLGGYLLLHFGFKFRILILHREI